MVNPKATIGLEPWIGRIKRHALIKVLELRKLSATPPTEKQISYGEDLQIRVSHRSQNTPSRPAGLQARIHAGSLRATEAARDGGRDPSRSTDMPGPLLQERSTRVEKKDCEELLAPYGSSWMGLYL